MAKKRTRSNHLVCEYLEGISRKLLEDYQDIIRDFIKGHHGLYALYKGDKLYYVGLATNLRARLTTHLRDRHKNSWNRFSVYLIIDDKHIKELESLFLRILLPEGNTQKGKFPKAINLRKTLEGEIRQRQKQEYDVLMGKRQKVTRKKTKRSVVKKAQRNSETILGPYIDKPLKLVRTYKGVKYVARVRRDGWVTYNGYLYRSPSGVAKEITGRAVNGWGFWNFERAPGQWVKLKTLRR